METPAIVFVHGFWEGTVPFIPLVQRLHKRGYNASIASWPSLGHTSPGNPNQDDDIAAIRAFIEPYVNQGRKVVVVCHSWAGYEFFKTRFRKDQD
jgi:alpha-beta hydrolase superfamily lysophospholipase